MGLQVVDGGYGGVVDFLFGGLDAHLMEFQQVVVDGPRGIVSQERIGDAQVAQLLQEGMGIGEEGIAQIDGAVHVEGDMTDAGKVFCHLVLITRHTLWQRLFHNRRGGHATWKGR